MHSSRGETRHELRARLSTKLRLNLVTLITNNNKDSLIILGCSVPEIVAHYSEEKRDFLKRISSSYLILY